MTHRPHRVGHVATRITFALAFAWLLSWLPPRLPAQLPCYDFGSTPVAGGWTASPVALGCATAAGWPQWHLYTPPHRAPGPHVGFNPGEARALPSILIAYRCTGWLLVPVWPIHVRTMGYVIDQPEIACAATTP